MNKEYNLKGFHDFLVNCESPREIMDAIANVAFNYAACLNGDNIEMFKADMNNLAYIYEAISKIE